MAPVMDCNVVVRAQHAVRQPLSYSTDRFLHWMPEKCSHFFFPPRTFLVLINPEVVQSTHHKQPAKQDEFSGASSQNANICYA